MLLWIGMGAVLIALGAIGYLFIYTGWMRFIEKK